MSSPSKPAEGSKKREERQREEDPKGLLQIKKVYWGNTEF